MADLENGFARVANEVLEGLSLADLLASEFRVVLHVIRETYGRPGSPKSAQLSVAEIAEATGLHRRTVRRALQTLERLGLITVSPCDCKSARSIGINSASTVFNRGSTDPLRAHTPPGGAQTPGGEGLQTPGVGVHRPSPTPSKSRESSDYGRPNTSKTRKTTSRAPAGTSGRASAKTPKPVRQVLDRYHSEYEDAHGVKPLIGKREAAQVKASLERIDLDELLEVVAWGARSNKPFFNSLSTLLSNGALNQARPAVRRERSGGPAPGRSHVPEIDRPAWLDEDDRQQEGAA